MGLGCLRLLLKLLTLTFVQRFPTIVVPGFADELNWMLSGLGGGGGGYPEQKLWKITLHTFSYLKILDLSQNYHQMLD
ncbi:hypothetical protein TorRG33x02_039940 [Trema orientale]|uniref:Uncharacterized protein n=1 Tax=Trema orientale TaxID=63057 RepID=A0A2P5FQY1_TREOI|nr:hypothetical protein TorRG33x02_039940 [Trema orientale]